VGRSSKSFGGGTGPLLSLCDHRSKAVKSTASSPSDYQSKPSALAEASISLALRRKRPCVGDGLAGHMPRWSAKQEADLDGHGGLDVLAVDARDPGWGLVDRSQLDLDHAIGERT